MNKNALFWEGKQVFSIRNKERKQKQQKTTK